MFPSKKKLLSQCEIRTCEMILENIQQLITEIVPQENITTEDLQQTSEANYDEEKQVKKIVLRGKRDV